MANDAKDDIVIIIYFCISKYYDNPCAQCTPSFTIISENMKAAKKFLVTVAFIFVLSVYLTIFHNDSLRSLTYKENTAELHHYQSLVDDARIREAEIAEKQNETDSFKKLAKELYVYSAFYDDITDSKKDYIRIIAIDNTSRVWDPPLVCNFYNENYVHLDTVPSLKVHSVDGDIRYKKVPALVFFLCEIHKDSYQNESIPTYISLKLPENGTSTIIENTDSPKDLMKIHYPPSQNVTPYQYRVATCMQPLIFPEMRHPLFLLEWLEYQFLLDVDHITFYNYNSSKEVLSLLGIYEAEGKVRIKDWPAPLPKVQGKLGAHWVALSDCSHGYRGIAKYVIVMDTDEFVVPSENHDKLFPYLEELWKQTEKKVKKKVSYIQFPSKFAFDNFPAGYYAVDLKDSKLNKIANKMQMPTRTAVIPGRQKKFVMRPELVLENGIHWPAAPTKNSAHVTLKDKEGFYLHFRSCDKQFKKPGPILIPNATCLETVDVVQEVSGTRRFGNVLVERVMRKIKGNDVLRKMFLESDDWL